jgi:hypothetical protein
MRAATVARLVVGTAFLSVPGGVLRAIGAPDRADRRVRTVTRVLGARIVGQAGLDVAGAAPARGTDAAVELAHAASMLPVVALWPVHRRAASVSAAVAMGLAVLDLTGRSG